MLKREVESRSPFVPNEDGKMSDKRDYYDVLGVEKSASTSDLKNAFRRLARKYHPDRSTEDDAEDRFKEIQEAYAVLSDDQKRAQYDRFGHNGPQGSPFGGFGGGGFNINLEDILGGDFFSSFFGGGSRRQRSRRGSDILIRHSITLEDVYLGSEQEVVVDLPEPCSTCDGTGAKGGTLTTCSSCSGQGQVRVRQQVGPFIQEAVQPCQDCGGAVESPTSRAVIATAEVKNSNPAPCVSPCPKVLKMEHGCECEVKANLLPKALANRVICSSSLRSNRMRGLSGRVQTSSCPSSRLRRPVARDVGGIGPP